MTVVTSHDSAGKLGGLTANSVASVSLDPPLVLVCVDKKSDSYPLFAASQTFAVNILANEQETLSRRFAKSGGDKFTGVGYRIGSTGCPIPSDTIAFLDCRVRYVRGQATTRSTSARRSRSRWDRRRIRLLYFRGSYRNLSA